MKKLFFFLFLVVGLIATAQFKSAMLQASGLTCAMCSNAINKSLKTLSFIEKIETDLNKSSFNIVFKKGADINFDQLRKKVEDAGFSVAKLEIVTVFNNASIQNDQPITVNGKVLHFVNVQQQVLSGEKTITIVDKSFVPVKEYKKYASLTKAASFKTGENKGVRIYHVTI